MLKRLLLAATAALVLAAPVPATAGLYADDECVGVFQVIRARGKSVSLAHCEFDKTPSAEIKKIVKICGRPYDVTHREPPDNAVICRVHVAGGEASYRRFDVRKVVSVSRTTAAEARSATERYLKKQELIPENSTLEEYLKEIGREYHYPTR